MVEPLSNIVIGIGAPQHVGKTTVANMAKNWIEKNQPRRYVGITGFAKALKDEATLLGWDGMKGDRGRQFLQDIGAAARRYNPDTWIEKVREAEEGAMFWDDVLIIDDARHINEVEWINSCPQSLTIRVVGEQRSTPTGDLSHPSETEIDQSPYRCVIENDGTLDELRATVNAAMAVFFEGLDS